MLSTLVESFGLAAITVGVTAGVWVLTGFGWALVCAGCLAGGSLLFVGAALSAPEIPSAARGTPKPRSGVLTNDQVERA